MKPPPANSSLSDEDRAIPNNDPPVLDRLNLSPELWLHAVEHFGKRRAANRITPASRFNATASHALQALAAQWAARRMWRTCPGHNGSRFRFGWPRVFQAVAGFWWASVPRDEWPQTPGFEEAVMKHWDSNVGDCRQELVFIGIDMDEAVIRKSLEACLLTQAECEAGVDRNRNG